MGCQIRHGKLTFALMKLGGLDHVAIAVTDVERLARWYVDVLGFERMHDGEWGGVPTFVGIGESGIALFPKTGTELRDDGGVLHFAFRATRESFLAAQRELKKRGIRFHFEDHGISHSIYFRDPDRHELEITTYELH